MIILGQNPPVFMEDFVGIVRDIRQSGGENTGVFLGVRDCYGDDAVAIWDAMGEPVARANDEILCRIGGGSVIQDIYEKVQCRRDFVIMAVFLVVYVGGGVAVFAVFAADTDGVKGGW
jgi:hypothetical protein